MRKIFFALTALLSISLFSCAKDINMANNLIPPQLPQVPQDGKTLVFGGQNDADSVSFVEINGRVPYGFTIYTSLYRLEGLDTEVDHGAGKTHARFLMEKYPGTAFQIGLYLVELLPAVIDGTLDDSIVEFAQWIKSTGVPVYLRIGYEFDYPENGYDPKLYIKAYRKIVDKFRELGVTNVAYVWHSYAGENLRGIEAWYPGDEYVDWCAISYFTNPDYGPMLKFAKAHSKPFMIAECSPILGDYKETSKMLAWFKSVFKFIEENNVKAFCYINADWNSQPMFAHFQWGSGRLDQNKEIKNFWLNAIKSERFIFQK